MRGRHSNARLVIGVGEGFRIMLQCGEAVLELR